MHSRHSRMLGAPLNTFYGHMPTMPTSALQQAAHMVQQQLEAP